MDDFHRWLSWMTAMDNCHWGLSWIVFMDDFHGWLSWMAFMDDIHGWLSWMTFMDDIHGWLSWMAFMDDYHGWLSCISHGWLDFAVYKLFLHIDKLWTDRQMDRQTDIGTFKSPSRLKIINKKPVGAKIENHLKASSWSCYMVTCSVHNKCNKISSILCVFNSTLY